MFTTIEIKPLVGINNIEFGMSVSKIVELAGKPDQVDNLTEDVDPLNIEMLHYDQAQVSLFVEGKHDLLLNSCDSENPESEIFGQKLFKLKEKAIIQLFAENGYTEMETENEEWGEKRISFVDALVDLYFIGGKLISITWGLSLED